MTTDTFPAPDPLKWVLRLALAALGLAAVSAALWATRPPPPLETLSALPDFTFTRQDGRAYGLKDLKGQVWVADFIFTRCPSVCPVLTAKLQRVARDTAELGDKLKLVSFSVDPDFDQPAVLTAYAASHKLDPARFTLLTGPTEAIEKTIVQGFKELVDRSQVKGPDDFLSIVHGGHFVLVDGEGALRGYYDANDDEDLARLERDARQLVRYGH
jgi:protein SCO1/2